MFICIRRLRRSGELVSVRLHADVRVRNKPADYPLPADHHFLVVLLVFNTWRLTIIVKQLRQSTKRERIANSSKSLSLSRMSHEIRTPLNAVIGYNTIAKGELAEAKDNTD